MKLKRHQYVIIPKGTLLIIPSCGIELTDKRFELHKTVIEVEEECIVKLEDDCTGVVQ